MRERRIIPTLPESDWHRLASRFDIGEKEDCWEWKGTTDKGYGLFSIGHSNWPAHRVLFSLLKEQPRWDIHHVCENTLCVNPHHLVEVTHGNPIHRHNGPSEYECAHGHPWTVENTYLRPDNGLRQCRRCYADASARWRQRRDERVQTVARPWPESLLSVKQGLLDRINR